MTTSTVHPTNLNTYMIYQVPEAYRVIQIGRISIPFIIIRIRPVDANHSSKPKLCLTLLDKEE